ncbi:hypothetical protein F7R14_23255 [Pseudomonas lini]|uniref:Uncharacterized protein n=1 Tax=Pseudomonas lini TaxID=163011 RepID=A0A7V7P0N4_9PSED|nr:hypothetical protein F7R14_23255 [Pseudomonas lini]
MKSMPRILQQPHFVGAAEGCDLLILIFGRVEIAQSQKIAACGSSYREQSTPLWCIYRQIPFALNITRSAYPSELLDRKDS